MITLRPATELKEMSIDKLNEFINEVKVLQKQHDYYKTQSEKLQKDYELVLWNRDNDDEAFAQQQFAELYKKQITWLDKIVLVIKTEDRFLTVVEIFEILWKFDSFRIREWKGGRDSLSQMLAQGRSYGRIKSVKVKGRKGYFYGLLIFYDEQGKLHEQYRQQIFF
ncbi:MAG TPA: hypothetical protein VN026_10270 [Bacteroidia bacterium]|jgi:hypothetical protein|nr:hypothetical protein [Bacteroidia bacterium]